MSHYTRTSIITKYVIGYIASLLLTTFSFGLIWFATTQEIGLQTIHIAGIVFISAILQLLIQLFLFLHLGEEKRPRWNLYTFLFMSLVVIIVVVGSLWIMANLNYRMMSPETLQHHINKTRSSGF